MIYMEIILEFFILFTAQLLNYSSPWIFARPSLTTSSMTFKIFLNNSNIQFCLDYDDFVFGSLHRLKKDRNWFKSKIRKIEIGDSDCNDISNLEKTRSQTSDQMRTEFNINERYKILNIKFIDLLIKKPK